MQHFGRGFLNSKESEFSTARQSCSWVLSDLQLLCSYDLCKCFPHDYPIRTSHRYSHVHTLKHASEACQQPASPPWAYQHHAKVGKQGPGQLNQSQRPQPVWAENGVCQRYFFLILVLLNWIKSPSVQIWSGCKENRNTHLLRSCVVLDFTLAYFPCALMEHLKMQDKHSECRYAQHVCKMPLWLVLIAGLRRGYTFKEYNLASFLPSSHCGNTSVAREVFKKGRTLQEQLEAKADECLILSCFEVVSTGIWQIEKVSVVVPICQKHTNHFSKGRYIHLPGNGLVPSSKSCSSSFHSSPQ